MADSSDNVCSQSELAAGAQPLTKADMLEIFNSKAYDQACYRAMKPILDEVIVEFKAMKSKINVLENKVKAQQEQINSLLETKVSKEKSEKYKNLIITGIRGKPEESHLLVKQFLSEKLNVFMQDAEIGTRILRVKNRESYQLQRPGPAVPPGNNQTAMLPPGQYDAGNATDAQPLKILCSFANIWRKREVWSKRRSLKGTNIFLNEDLTKEDSSLLYECRQLKKQRLIKHCYSNDMVVYVLTNQGTEIPIKSSSDLQDIKSQVTEENGTRSKKPGTSTPVDSIASMDSWHDTTASQLQPGSSLDMSSFLGFTDEERNEILTMGN